MEAALRSVSELITGEELSEIDYHAVRGMNGVKEAEVQIGDKIVKVAVVHTLSNARIILDKIRNNEANYHFIEIMACPGGCIGGGCQPVSKCQDIRQKRAEAIYNCDAGAAIRKSHKNPAIQELYDTWLGKPLGEKSHKILHTHYHPQHKIR